MDALDNTYGDCSVNATMSDNASNMGPFDVPLKYEGQLNDAGEMSVIWVEDYDGDTWVSPSPSISSLRIQEKGILGKGKKQKIDLGKSTYMELEFHRTSTTSPLEDIGFDISTIRELVSSSLEGLGEPSTTHHSYVSQFNYEKHRIGEMERYELKLKEIKWKKRSSADNLATINPSYADCGPTAAVAISKDG
ncbi:hypothetical protein FXO38_12076 [Capsicum annuum]|nr:hypothetical protein FXO37_33030 [Capsicum annuum]KAF3660658.1 hypothetical protein FXO38_12076 [Capsicum annuum]